MSATANEYKRGQYVILNNGEGMIGHGSICKITKIEGLKVWLKAPWMGGKTHPFTTSQIMSMPELSIKPIMCLTVEQNQWLDNYYKMTGFEPTHLDDLEKGTMLFHAVAHENLQWYEDHTAEIFTLISQAYNDLSEDE